MAIADRHGGARRVVPWLERLDPLTVLCAVAAFVVFLPHGFDGALTLDLGIYGYGGQQVAEGVLPYVGVVNRVGPLADLLAGAGAFVSGGVGIDEVLGMRLVFMMLSITCIVLVYLLARELFSCRLFGLVAAAALLSFQGFIDYATYGPREKTAMVMFVLASLLSMTYQRWLTTGVLISLATLVWQPALFALIAGATVVILLGTRRQDWLPAMVRVLVGGAIPMAVVVGTYAAAGELSAFLDCFIVINAFYTHQPSFLDRRACCLGHVGVGVWGVTVDPADRPHRPDTARPSHASLTRPPHAAAKRRPHWHSCVRFGRDGLDPVRV